MTYLQFLLLFIVPPLLLLAPRGEAGAPARLRLAALVLPVIALVFTTPWDNYLVASGVWEYGHDRVLGTIGWVPIEEYLFFLLQPLLALVWLVRLRLHVQAVLPARTMRVLGVLFWFGVAVAGVLMLRDDPTRYLGLILAWACPVLALQWWFTGDVLRADPRRYLLVVLPPAAYLWIADAIAIRAGIWHISERYTTGFHLLGLPLEEATFFLMTHLLSIHGALLLLQPARFARGRH